MGYNGGVVVPPVSPIIVKVVEKPAQEVGVAEILIQAIGLTGLLLIGSALLGLLLGGLFIGLRLFRRRHAFGADTSDRVRLGLGM